MEENTSVIVNEQKSISPMLKKEVGGAAAKGSALSLPPINNKKKKLRLNSDLSENQSLVLQGKNN